MPLHWHYAISSAMQPEWSAGLGGTAALRNLKRILRTHEAQEVGVVRPRGRRRSPASSALPPEPSCQGPGRSAPSDAGAPALPQPHPRHAVHLRCAAVAAPSSSQIAYEQRRLLGADAPCSTDRGKDVS